MICNSTVEIINGTPSDNGWGDTVVTEAAPIKISGHIGNEREVNDRDGLILRRCTIRIPSDIIVAKDTVFRVAGKRWKPLSFKVSRNPQNYAAYNCQRLD